MSEDFRSRIRRAMQMGQAFYEMYEDFVTNHLVLVFDFEQFKERLRSDSTLSQEDVIVFEKMIGWKEQSIWFSRVDTMENARLKFLTKGIEVLDDAEDEEGLTLLMREPA